MPEDPTRPRPAADATRPRPAASDAAATPRSAAGGTGLAGLAGTIDRDLLRALVDTVQPSDADPGGLAAGVDTRLLAAVADQRADWEPRLAAVLTTLAQHDPHFADADPSSRLAALESLLDDPGYYWLAGLVHDLFWGHSPDATVSGRQVAGWPEITVEPEIARHDLPAGDLTRWEDVADSYDAVVVGAGAGGGMAAHELAASGRTVLLVERGGWPTAASLRRDDLATPRATSGFEPSTGPTGTDELRRLPDGRGGTRLLRAADPGWGNNAMTIGGGTRVYGAQAWRFTPEDLTMASRYGVPDGSALADWPIGYADLEPHYTAVEQQLGVCGSPREGDRPDPWAGPRSAPLPMPAQPLTRIGSLLRGGADRLGWGTLPVPLLLNSQPRHGRAGCVRCPQCVGFACPVDARAGTHNTLIPAALATGRGRLLAGAVGERLLVERGRVVGVRLVSLAPDGSRRQRDVRAGRVLLAAGAIETARLLLHSAHPGEPDGVGNRHDQVGRHLQAHAYAGATGVFDDEVVDFVGPGPSIASCDLRHGNDDLVGGGMLAAEFVPTAAAAFRWLVDAGLVPPHGPGARDGMRRLGRRTVRLAGPVHEVTTAGARVRLDPSTRDRYGRPGVELSGGLHPEDVRVQGFLSERAAEWLLASGARRAVAAPAISTSSGPSRGQHQAGTCRMGTDPTRSVVDPAGRVWGHDNLYVVDGSSHVTNGGVNPVLTILANARRISRAIPA